MAHKTPGTFALVSASGRSVSIVTMRDDGTLVMADTGLTFPCPAGDFVWTTAAAVTSAMRVRGTACDPNVTRMDTLPLVLDVLTNIGYVTDPETGLPRNTVPHACGIGFDELMTKHPNFINMSAALKARLYAARG